MYLNAGSTGQLRQVKPPTEATQRVLGEETTLKQVETKKKNSISELAS